MIDIARVVQGALELCSLVPKVSRTQSRARSSFAEPQPTLAEHFPNALQRYEIRRIDVFNIEDAHARQNSCEHGSALA